MTSVPQFRRVVLGLQPGAIDRRSLEFSAEIADLFGAFLQGVFIQDDDLGALASASPLRELHLPKIEWRPMQAKDLAEDMGLAARCARRILQGIASNRGVESFFQVLDRKSLTQFWSGAHADDILIFSPPRQPQERLAPPPFDMKLLNSAALSAVFLPRRLSRRKGPVVGVVSAAGNAAWRVAAACARAAGERLSLLVPAEALDREGLLEAAVSLGLERSNIELRILARLDTRALLSALQTFRERLIVLPPPDEENPGRLDAAVIASQRLTPVLLVGRSFEVEP